jgi:hypothetical protein
MNEDRNYITFIWDLDKQTTQTESLSAQEQHDS